MKVFVAGASGALGQPLIAAFRPPQLIREKCDSGAAAGSWSLLSQHKGDRRRRRTTGSDANFLNRAI